MKIVERVSPEAVAFYHEQLEHYKALGLPAEEATECADLDLLEWSRPLDLPGAPASEWF